MNTRHTLDALDLIRTEATASTFRGAFGVTFGDHLWQRFNELDNDVIALYATLDSHNREQFAILVDLIAEVRVQEVSA